MAHRLKTIQKNLKYWQSALDVFRASCEHVNVSKTPKNNATYDGNDFYYDCTCLDCGTRWIEEQ